MHLSPFKYTSNRILITADEVLLPIEELDLLNFYAQQRLKKQLANFLCAYDFAAPKQKLFLICLQYDSIYRSLPDPGWWISDSPDFAKDFLTHSEHLAENRTASSSWSSYALEYRGISAMSWAMPTEKKL